MTTKISAIIPTRNRCSALMRVLNALEGQRCSKDLFEVIVIDDGSTDNTVSIVETFSTQTSLKICLVKGAGISAGDARNRGVTSATGDYLIFLDSDSIPNPEFIKHHLQLQESFAESNGCVIGRVTMSPELATKKQARQWETDINLQINQLKEVDWWMFRTSNASLSRSIFSRCGGFHSHLIAAEDTEIAYRLSKLGARFYYAPHVSAEHYHPMTIRDYLRKGAMYGHAVAKWYLESPELRTALSQRYGVYIAEMPLTKKFKYFLRACLVNRLSLPFILLFGKIIRNIMFKISEQLYKCAYKYRVRRSFRESLASSFSV